MYRRLKKEEHINLIQESVGNYLGHLTPQKSTGNEIASRIFCCLKNNKFDYAKIDAVGSNETATNPGWKKGVTCNLELKFGRPLQEFISLLCFNELSFRHFLKE